MNKFFIYIVLLLGCLSLASCSSEPDPEEQIRQYISKFETKAEDRNLRGIKKLVSENYEDKNKRTRKEILQIAAAYFLRNKNINSLSRIESLVFSNTNTSARLTVYVAISKTALQEDDIELLQADVHHFEIELQNVSHQWKLSSAEWQRASIEDFLQE